MVVAMASVGMATACLATEAVTDAVKSGSPTTVSAAARPPAARPAQPPAPVQPDADAPDADIPAADIPSDAPADAPVSTEPVADDDGLGRSTGLELPRWVSLKAAEANVRRGPALGHRIDWVFKHRNMPLLVTAEFGHWRRVVDRDGDGGWIHYVLLSSIRTVIVDQDMLELHRDPDPASEIVAKAQKDAIAKLLDCQNDWCRISADGIKGWVPQSAIWGVNIPSDIKAGAEPTGDDAGQ